jgi:diguanylate cyclase
MQDTPPPPAERRGRSLARRIYGPRVVGLGLGAICVGAGLLQAGAPSWLWLVLVCNGFVWPHLAYQWATRSRAPFAAEHRNLLLDSVAGGFWVPAMAFNLLPSVLILTMLSMDNIAVGGVRLFLKGLAAHAAGALIAVAILGLRFEPASNLATIAASLPFLVTYPIVIGVVTYRLSLQLSAQKNALRLLHERDSLSGLYSRSHWLQRLDEAFHAFHRHGRPISIVLLDVDHFKDINDNHGHAAGDEAIRHLGQLLRTEVRQSDVAGRLGGEEFGVILHDADAKQAARTAERIRRTLATTVLPIGKGLQLTVSIGVAQLGAADPGSMQWLERADRALYRAKSDGRNAVRIAPASPPPSADHAEQKETAAA